MKPQAPMPPFPSRETLLAVAMAAGKGMSDARVLEACGFERLGVADASVWAHPLGIWVARYPLHKGEGGEGFVLEASFQMNDGWGPFKLEQDGGTWRRPMGRRMDGTAIIGVHVLADCAVTLIERVEAMLRRGRLVSFSQWWQSRLPEGSIPWPGSGNRWRDAVGDVLACDVGLDGAISWRTDADLVAWCSSRSYFWDTGRQTGRTYPTHTDQALFLAWNTVLRKPDPSLVGAEGWVERLRVGERGPGGSLLPVALILRDGEPGNEGMQTGLAILERAPLHLLREWAMQPDARGCSLLLSCMEGALSAEAEQEDRCAWWSIEPVIDILWRRLGSEGICLSTEKLSLRDVVEKAFPKWRASQREARAWTRAVFLMAKLGIDWLPAMRAKEVREEDDVLLAKLGGLLQANAEWVAFIEAIRLSASVEEGKVRGRTRL